MKMMILFFTPIEFFVVPIIHKNIHFKFGDLYAGYTQKLGLAARNYGRLYAGYYGDFETSNRVLRAKS